MNKDSFEQMESELEKLCRPLKEERIPDEIFKNFETQVRRKIIEQDRRTLPLGVWYAALAASCVTIATIGILIWKMNIKAPEPLQEPARKVLAQSPASAGLKPPAPERHAQRTESAQRKESLSLPDPRPEPAPLTEFDLVAEIQALQELGVWTEEDDHAIGISPEQSLDELEIGLETENPALQSNPLSV